MAEQKKNGIPQKGPDTGNYWCTWDTQFRVNSVEDGKDTKNLRNVLTQDFLFAEDGMLRNYFKNVRQDLYVLLDDGWDVGKDVPGNGAVSVFADDSAIPTWARGAVYALTAAGVFNGDGEGAIRPSALLDRASTVQMLYNMQSR